MRSIVLLGLVACADEGPTAPASTPTSPEDMTGSLPPATPGPSTPTPTTGSVHVAVDGGYGSMDLVAYDAEVRVAGVVVHQEHHTGPSFVVDAVEPGPVEVFVTHGSWEARPTSGSGYTGITGCFGDGCSGSASGTLGEGADLELVVPLACASGGCD